MHMYRLAGTPQQIGVEYGELLRAARVRLPPLSSAKQKFADACEPHVEKHAPALLDELDGIAAGGEYDRARLRMIALGLGARSACSVVAISGAHTADGKPLFGRNLDWYRATLRDVALCHITAEGALPSLGFNDVLVGRMAESMRQVWRLRLPRSKGDATAPASCSIWRCAQCWIAARAQRRRWSF